MARVIHFELTAEDPERAAAFWRAAFGWSIHRWEGAEYWLAGTGEGPGIDGALMRAADAHGGRGATTVTVEVDDIADAVARVEAAGGRVVVAAIDIPSVGRLAYCEDTEGTYFGILQPAPRP